MNALVFVLFFGVFEGAYNHVLKNVLFLAGLSASHMRALFPPPMYEMPDDLFFEITGVPHVIPAFLAARYLARLLPRVRVSGRPLTLLPAHMAIGVAFVMALWLLAVLAARAGLRPTLVLAAIAWGLVVPAFGVVQTRLLPGPAHWVVRVAHLLIGIVAMVVAARLARFIHSSAPLRAVHSRSARGGSARRHRAHPTPLMEAGGASVGERAVAVRAGGLWHCSC